MIYLDYFARFLGYAFMALGGLFAMLVAYSHIIVWCAERSKPTKAMIQLVDAIFVFQRRSRQELKQVKIDNFRNVEGDGI